MNVGYITVLNPLLEVTRATLYQWFITFSVSNFYFLNSRHFYREGITSHRVVELVFVVIQQVLTLDRSIITEGNGIDHFVK